MPGPAKIISNKGLPRHVLGAAMIPLIAALAGCPTAPTDTAETINPFQDLPEIARDGRAVALTTTIAPLGALNADEVIEVEVTGGAIDAVLILAEDEVFDEAGVMVGGGPANAAFNYRARDAGRYFAFVQFAPTADDDARQATIQVQAGDPSHRPPATQAVRIVFEADYLTDPGLFDPDAGTDDQRAFLESISDQVRDAIIVRLEAIFADTPIVILDQDEPAGDAPVSRVTFRPDRVLAEAQDVIDSALPPLDTDRPECADRVIFGEVLPEGSGLQDPGNQTTDDEAVVYVGSFQGRGETCQSAAINSVNNIVLGLAQTAAHEIGHLVGLYHGSLVDLMDRSPSNAFQRELTFQRTQIVIETPDEETIEPVVLTTVIQDPDRYFHANFSSQ
jgi:hypothetical protein